MISLKKIYVKTFLEQIFFVLLSSIIFFFGCSKEYIVGKIQISDETNLNLNVNISEIAERLLKNTKYIGISSPDRANSSLKITLSEINISNDKRIVKNRYKISLSLTVSTNNEFNIFYAESTERNDLATKDTATLIKYLLHDSIQKLDYQCKIRKYNESELTRLFMDKKTTKWQKEAIIEEAGNRLNNSSIKGKDNIFNFLYSLCFLKFSKEYGDKIIGIFSSTDFSKLNLNEDRKNEISSVLTKYSLDKEPHIQIHTITILGKIGNDLARAIIFTFSTGSQNKNVRDHAKEVLNELQKKGDYLNNIITSK